MADIAYSIVGDGTSRISLTKPIDAAAELTHNAMENFSSLTTWISAKINGEDAKQTANVAEVDRDADVADTTSSAETEAPTQVDVISTNDQQMTNAEE